MNRRQFLMTSGAAAVATAAAGSSIVRAASRSGAVQRVGIQLYTVRSLMETDPVGTLRRIADLGYDEVEFAGYFDMPVSQTRNLLSDLGLAAPSTHANLSAMRESADTWIENCVSIGHEFLVCSWMSEEQRTTADAWRGIAHEFNHFGEKCRDAGIRFAFHNHDFEFVPVDGVKPYDILLERTDADLVKMELDLFWATAAGVDVPTLLARHPERFKLFHVKDMTPERTMTSVGDGIIDFPTLLDTTAKIGGLHWYVEHDHPEDAMASATRSLAYLRSL